MQGRSRPKEEATADDKKELKDEKLEGVAGGRFSEDGNCPYCGSSNKVFSYDHDEIAVFDCKDCGQRFSYRFG